MWPYSWLAQDKYVCMYACMQVCMYVCMYVDSVTLVTHAGLQLAENILEFLDLLAPTSGVLRELSHVAFSIGNSVQAFPVTANMHSPNREASQVPCFAFQIGWPGVPMILLPSALGTMLLSSLSQKKFTGTLGRGRTWVHIQGCEQPCPLSVDWMQEYPVSPSAGPVRPNWVPVYSHCLCYPPQKPSTSRHPRPPLITFNKR